MLVHRVRHALGLAAVVVVPNTSSPCVAYAQVSEQEFRAALVADPQTDSDKSAGLADAIPDGRMRIRYRTFVPLY